MVLGGLLASGLLLLGVLTVSGIALFGPKQVESGATCMERMGTTCTNLPLASIEKVAEVDLPEGTSVVRSRYEAFQDWHLEAVVDLPPGAPSPMTTPELQRLYDGHPHDGVVRQVEVGTGAQGRTRLTLTAFTS